MSLEDYKLVNSLPTVKCPHCLAENPQGKSYCADCGTPLSPLIASVDSFLEAQVQRIVRNELRDRERSESAVAEAIATRLHRGARILAFAVGIPLILLVLLLGLAGFKVYRDFSRVLQEAEIRLRTRLEQVERDAQEAQRRATEIRQTVERAAAQADRELDSARGINWKLRILANRLSVLEKQATGRINGSNNRASAEIQELRARLESVSKQISEQQSRLVQTNELVKALLSSGQTEFFNLDRDTARIVAIAQSENQVSVYIRLKDVPIAQTLELQWRGQVQPKNSYSVQRNLVLFRWGQALDSLRQNPVAVTYVPDPTAAVQVVHTLLARDGRVYADGDLLPLLFR